MKQFFEKSFNISLIMGALTVVACMLGMNHFIFIFISLFTGFLGFVLCCLHIVLTQKFNLPQKPGCLMMLSLFLNSVPLFYMMVQIMQHSGGK
ncbi:MAG TPA: hypothetical protein VK783_08695 [Bacteroidia bacterium]|nr:hypothetical protein [Bacteroidia bacterium]